MKRIFTVWALMIYLWPTGPDTALSLILVKFRDVVDQKMLKIAQKCHFCGIKATMGAAKVHHLLSNGHEARWRTCQQ